LVAVGIFFEGLARSLTHCPLGVWYSSGEAYE